MKIVRAEYRRNGETYKPIGFVTFDEIESAGYEPVASHPSIELPSGDRIWLFQTLHENVHPTRTWFGQFRAGCDHCLAPVEFHTGSPQTIGATSGRSHVICKTYRD